jgi:glycosyltransferase involved in cell wall biosynthesis
MEPGPRVMLILPSSVMVHMNFTLSLALMAAGTSMSGIRLGFMNPRGIYIQKNRWRSVKKSLELGCEYILFIDSDMSFPPDALVRLLKADKDIVGANYVRRSPPYDSLAKANGGDQDVSGVVVVDGLPTGLLLIRSSVFDKLPQPWFDVTWNDEDFLGEDYYFCNLAREHGFKIWMDCDLSAEVVHWGEMGFRWTGEGSGYKLVPEND